MAPAARQQHLWFGRARRWGARTAALALALLAVAGGYIWLTTELPTPERLRARAALGSTRILDRQGKLLYELPDPLSGRQRPVPLSAIPLALRQATIAIEDTSFYQNPGLDIRGIARAAWADLRSGDLVAGGSTITQQLARGFLLDPELARQRTLARKLREAALALKLTASYPKDEILELYLNQSYYGGRAYGVEAAARHYFGKPARDLDLAECALLAGLPQAPSRYNPVTNPKAAEVRRHHVDAGRRGAAPARPLLHVLQEQRVRRARIAEGDVRAERAVLGEVAEAGARPTQRRRWALVVGRTIDAHPVAVFFHVTGAGRGAADVEDSADVARASTRGAVAQLGQIARAG